MNRLLKAMLAKMPAQNLKQSEAALQTKIINHLRKNKFYYFKVIRSSRSGTPDIIACKDGLFIGIEVKAEKGKLSKLQKLHQTEVKKKKGLHFVVKPSTYNLFIVTLKDLFN